jgi:hypothetical protein
MTGELPARPDLKQTRRQAKDLLRAAKSGDAHALAQLRAVSDDVILASAQPAVARAHGFPSWAQMLTEVERREILTTRDTRRLGELPAGDPGLAARSLEQWCDHPKGARPLGFIAMLRFDASRLGLSGDLPGTGAIARALLAAGAPVDGEPGDPETPLITAAGYGDADVARELIAAGADLEAVAAPNAGGVPGWTALLHAAVFGMTPVLDLLALAADHERLGVIDELLAAGTPIDATDAVFGRQAMRTARENGREASVAHLLARGAAA